MLGLEKTLPKKVTDVSAWTWGLVVGTPGGFERKAKGESLQNGLRERLERSRRLLLKAILCYEGAFKGQPVVRAAGRGAHPEEESVPRERVEEDSVLRKPLEESLVPRGPVEEESVLRQPKASKTGAVRV